MSDAQRPTGDDEGVVARTAGATGGFLTGALGGVDLRQPFREAPDLTSPRSTWRVVAPLLLVLAAGAGAIVWGDVT